MKPVHFLKPACFPLRYSVEVRVWARTLVRQSVAMRIREELR